MRKNIYIKSNYFKKVGSKSKLWEIQVKKIEIRTF